MNEQAMASRWLTLHPADIRACGARANPRTFPGPLPRFLTAGTRPRPQDRFRTDIPHDEAHTEAARTRPASRARRPARPFERGTQHGHRCSDTPDVSEAGRERRARRDLDHPFAGAGARRRRAGGRRWPGRAGRRCPARRAGASTASRRSRARRSTHDFKSRDFVGWPQQENWLYALRCDRVDAVYEGYDLGVLPAELRPIAVVDNALLSARRIPLAPEADPIANQDIYWLAHRPRGGLLRTTGRAADLRELRCHRRAKKLLDFNQGVIRYGAPVTRPTPRRPCRFLRDHLRAR